MDDPEHETPKRFFSIKTNTSVHLKTRSKSTLDIADKHKAEMATIRIYTKTCTGGI